MARPKPVIRLPAAILRVDRATGSLEKYGRPEVSDDPSRFLLNCHFPDAARSFASCSVFRRPSALSPRTGRSRYRFPLRIGASRHSNLICMRFLCLAVRLAARVRVIGTPAFPGARGRRPSALGPPSGRPRTAARRGARARDRPGRGRAGRPPSRGRGASDAIPARPRPAPPGRRLREVGGAWFRHPRRSPSRGSTGGRIPGTADAAGSRWCPGDSASAPRSCARRDSRRSRGGPGRRDRAPTPCARGRRVDQVAARPGPLRGSTPAATSMS